MAVILHIETATEVCSIAMARDGNLLALKEQADTREHAALVTRLIEAVSAEAGLALEALDAVAVSNGPGSYTSLRIGLSSAKGICYALDKPLIAVNTLEALAFGSYRQHPASEAVYLPMIDARRMEVYTAVFDAGLRQLKAPYTLELQAESFAPYAEDGYRLIFSGNGSPKYREVVRFEKTVFSGVRCSARHLIDPALRAWKDKRLVDPAYHEPFYLKPPNITKARNRLL